MPAPRKFNDAQRDAVWRLHESGLTSKEIATACAEGKTGLARFEIPDRTVRDVIEKMATETRNRLPATFADLESEKAVALHPARGARILGTELARLEAKANKGNLSEKDIELVVKLVGASEKVQRSLQKRQKQSATRRGTGERAGGPAREESALEKLAREQSGAEGGEVHVAPTRTRQGNSDVAAVDADAAIPETPARVSEPTLTIEERRIAAEKARAALAGVA